MKKSFVIPLPGEAFLFFWVTNITKASAFQIYSTWEKIPPPNGFEIYLHLKQVDFRLFIPFITRWKNRNFRFEIAL